MAATNRAHTSSESQYSRSCRDSVRQIVATCAVRLRNVGEDLKWRFEELTNYILHLMLDIVSVMNKVCDADIP